MRVLSQEGLQRVDLNYDLVGVSTNFKNPCEIIAWPLTDEYWTMAKYSSPEKAEKALEMLKEKYLSYLKCDGGLMATANFFVQPFAFVQPKVFQFPADEEITVEESEVKKENVNP